MRKGQSLFTTTFSNNRVLILSAQNFCYKGCHSSIWWAPFPESRVPWQGAWPSWGWVGKQKDCRSGSPIPRRCNQSSAYSISFMFTLSDSPLKFLERSQCALRRLSWRVWGALPSGRFPPDQTHRLLPQWWLSKVWTRGKTISLRWRKP